MEFPVSCEQSPTQVIFVHASHHWTQETGVKAFSFCGAILFCSRNASMRPGQQHAPRLETVFNALPHHPSRKDLMRKPHGPCIMALVAHSHACAE